MLKSKLIVILLFVTLGITSCKKDKEAKTTCALNETNLLGTYKYAAVTYKASPTSAAVNAISMVDSCSLDDLITIGTNGVFTFTDAGLQCNPSDSGTSTWSLQGNILTLDSQSGIIDNFTCTSFTIGNANFFTPGDTLLITFQRK